MTMRELVGRLPDPVKQGLKYAYGALPLRIRYGRVFWETYNFLQESQWWPRERLEEYQLQVLRGLLSHAYKTVPYYREVFDEYGLKPERIQDYSDLRRCPTLSKDILKARSTDLLSRMYDPARLPKSHTSGTTGKPLQFFKDPHTEAREMAFIFHQWARVGYKPGDLRVELRGPVNRDRPASFDPSAKVLRLSPLIESKEQARYYIESIERTGAKFLHGYPGAISSFALLIRKHDLDVPFSLKAVLFASEKVYKWQREVVEDVFRCRVFSHYGQAEKVVLAAECEHSFMYHCIPQYGITEIDESTGEIIGTGFVNWATPFIRYRTTDRATLPALSRCEQCGREYYPVVADIEGRFGDFIVTPTGAVISPAVITHPFKDLRMIKETQVVQKEENAVVVRAVPWDVVDREALETELNQLCRELRDIIGTSIQVRWEIADAIERSTSGKFKWIVSEVSREVGWCGVAE